jgi:pyridoxal phosphate enzyme (YggS family)
MITENLLRVKETLLAGVELIAVSKTKPASDIQTLYTVGQRAFGENKVQELVEKQEVLPKDIQWHLIGHLQTNKVKYVAPFVHLIHGVDSFKLLKEINKEAIKNNRIIPCLIQFHIAQEETKFGFSFEEAQEMLESNDFVELQNVAIHGVMGMASFTDDENLIHEEFQTLHNYFQLIKSHYFKFNPDFKELSMGMSGDYKIAMEEGSTMVRVGSTIFGSR